MYFLGHMEILSTKQCKTICEWAQSLISFVWSSKNDIFDVCVFIHTYTCPLHISVQIILYGLIPAGLLVIFLNVNMFTNKCMQSLGLICFVLSVHSFV